MLHDPVSISDDAEESGTQTQLAEGMLAHLSDMILELQQLSLRMGAADISNHLQLAYLEALRLRKTALDHAQPHLVARKRGSAGNH
ncbi:MAG: hypothetical protein AAFQ42_08905 [Pseudomonadota bacterium]